MYEIETLDL